MDSQLRRNIENNIALRRRQFVRPGLEVRHAAANLHLGKIPLRRRHLLQQFAGQPLLHFLANVGKLLAAGQ